MKEIKMTFKCPKCGGTELSVMQRYAEMRWDVAEIVKDEYGMISVVAKDGDEFPDDAEVLEEYYCCSHCGEVITEGDDAFVPAGEEGVDE